MQNEWADALKVWLEGQKSHTARSYRQALGDLMEFLSKRPDQLGEVAGSDIAAWKNDMSARLSESTVAQRLAAASSFYEFCRKTYTDVQGQPLAALNPVMAVKRPHVRPFGMSRPLTAKQFVDLRAQIDHSTVIGMRDDAMILFAVYTGRRSHELRELTVGYLQYNANGTMRYRWRGKRGKARWDDLPHPVWEAIQLYWAAAGRNPGLNEPIFIAHNGHDRCEPLSSEAFRKIVKKYAKLAGLPNWVNVHTLRHTAAAFRLKRGILEINQLLHHGSLDTTRIYTETLVGFVDEGWPDVEKQIAAAMCD